MKLIYVCFLGHAGSSVVDGAGTDDDFADLDDVTEVSFAVVGFAVVGFAVVGFAVVGFAVVGFAVVGFAVVGFSADGFGGLNPSASKISRATWRST
jgi:hypothetical protein